MCVSVCVCLCVCVVLVGGEVMEKNDGRLYNVYMHFIWILAPYGKHRYKIYILQQKQQASKHRYQQQQQRQSESIVFALC